MKTISSLFVVAFLLSTIPSQFFASDQLTGNQFDQQSLNSNTYMVTGLICMAMGSLTALQTIQQGNCCRRNRGPVARLHTSLSVGWIISGAVLVGASYALSPSFNP